MNVILDDYLVPVKRKKSSGKKRVILDHYLVRRGKWRKRQED